MTVPSCPDHGPMELVDSPVGFVYACRVMTCQECRRVDLVPRLRIQDEPSIQVERKIQRTPGLTEAQLVQQIRAALQQLGYEVLRVGQHRADRAGSDPGCADLLVRKRNWARGMWKACEIKLPGGKLSAEQTRLESEGGIIVIRSVSEAVEAVSS